MKVQGITQSELATGRAKLAAGVGAGAIRGATGGFVAEDTDTGSTDDAGKDCHKTRQTREGGDG